MRKPPPYRRVGTVLTKADLRLRAAQVRAFRASAWPPPRPAASAPPLPVQDIQALRARLLAPAPVASGRITVRRVLEATAGHFGTTVEALLSVRRMRTLSRPRQIAMFVARRMTGRSLPFIGQRMNDRDHTTILHGSRAVQCLIDAGDRGTIAAVGRIIERLTEDGADGPAGAEPWT